MRAGLCSTTTYMIRAWNGGDISGTSRETTAPPRHTFSGLTGIKRRRRQPGSRRDQHQPTRTSPQHQRNATSAGFSSHRVRSPLRPPYQYFLRNAMSFDCSATCARSRTSSARSPAESGSPPPGSDREPFPAAAIRRRSSRTHLCSRFSCRSSSRATSATRRCPSITLCAAEAVGFSRQTSHRDRCCRAYQPASRLLHAV
jgi:hypothetical protein